MDLKRERASESYVGEIRLLTAMYRVCDVKMVDKEIDFGESGVLCVDGWKHF